MSGVDGLGVGQRRDSQSSVSGLDRGHHLLGEEIRMGFKKAAQPFINGAGKLGGAGSYLAKQLRYGMSQVGMHGSMNYKLFLHDKDSQRPLSFWHDIPVFSDVGEAPLVNMITEVPKFTTAKMEINLKAEGNPIMQDNENGQPRFYPSTMYWNYGAIPQTWEDTEPAIEGELKGLQGDDDPLDIIEIGDRPLESGSITPVKCVGALCMIDGTEIDWKIIAVRPDDDIAKEVDDADDLVEKYPHIVSGIREWLRWYKTPKGKPLAKFAFGERLLGVREAMQVIQKNNHSYVKRFSTESLPTTQDSFTPKHSANGPWLGGPQN